MDKQVQQLREDMNEFRTEIPLYVEGQNGGLVAAIERVAELETKVDSFKGKIPDIEWNANLRAEFNNLSRKVTMMALKKMLTNHFKHVAPLDEFNDLKQEVNNLKATLGLINAVVGKDI